MIQRRNDIKETSIKRAPKTSRNQIMEKMEEFSKRTEKMTTALRKSKKAKA